MKKVISIAIMFFAMTQVWSQSNVISRIPLLGESAPSFIAESTTGTLDFPADFGSKWKILFSHPADFTPVCTSELMELAKMQQDFKDLNVRLAVISPDDLEMHKMWVNSMEDMIHKENAQVEIKFPLIDDSKLKIGWQYGMLTGSPDSWHAVRGVFIIDPQNKIRSIVFYPPNVGRNMVEIKRTVIALQTADKNTVLTPANWNPGDDVLLPYPKNYKDYSSNEINKNDVYSKSGYMIYQKLNN